MRKAILDQLRTGHQGIVRTKQRARLTQYWPGIDNDIENVITACTTCQDYLPSNTKETIQQKPRPSYPFKEIAADFCQHAGRYYLVVVDCYSDYPTIISMGRDITASHLIAAVRELISRTAVPDIFWSDGVRSSHQRSFKNLPNSGGSLAVHPLPTTHKVMERQRQQ